MGKLDGKRIAFLATDGVEQVELTEPRKVLDQADLGGPPDGIALSPDERYLYLTAGLGKLKRYAVAGDGTLSQGMTFAEGPPEMRNSTLRSKSPTAPFHQIHSLRSP